MSETNGRYMPPNDGDQSRPPESEPSTSPEQATPEAPPQYGQRSQNQGAPQSSSSAPQSNTPWPVYEPQAPAPSTPAPPSGWAGTPAANAAAYPGPSGYAGPTGPMPSRTGAIWMLVIGLVSMIVVAPVVFFVSMFSAMNIDAVVGGMVTDGATITVDDSGTIGVMSSTGVQPSSCTITGDGGEYTLTSVDGIVSATGVTPGSYTLDCGSQGTGAYVALSGDVIASMLQGTVVAFVVATIIGVIGLGLTIGGIVWLVSRNRARREYVRASWQ